MLGEANEAAASGSTFFRDVVAGPPLGVSRIVFALF